jgi:hypothetical protein
MRQMSEWRCNWCSIFAATFLTICVSQAAVQSGQSNATRLEDCPEYLSLERRFDEVYRSALASANQQQRPVLQDERARWSLEREKLRNGPDAYIAYTQQEIRYFAGSFDEPSGVLTFNDLSADEQALYDKGAFMEKLPSEPVLIFVFGKEDASTARSEGLSMTRSHYNRVMASQFLFAEGWDKYHDRFLTRAYVQEEMGAYEDGLKQ